MVGRPRKEQPPLPFELETGSPVKVTGLEFPGIKLGLVEGWCKYNDGGIYVWLTGLSTPTVSVYTCIQTDRGDTIQRIELKKLDGINI